MIKAEVMGRLTRDPEARAYGKGNKSGTLVRMCIACDNSHGKDEDTIFLDCVAFNGLGEVAENYLSKGDLVYVSGRLKPNEYDRKDKTHVETVSLMVDSIELCGSKEK